MLFQIFHLKALSWIIWINCLKPVTQSRFILTIKRFSAHTEENSRDCVSMSQATSSGCFCSDSFNPEFCKITYFTFSSLFAEKSSIFWVPYSKVKHKSHQQRYRVVSCESRPLGGIEKQVCIIWGLSRLFLKQDNIYVPSPPLQNPSPLPMQALNRF